MLDVNRVPDRIKYDIARNIGAIDMMADDYDPIADGRIAKLTPEQAFSYWCNWNGLPGWGPTILSTLDYLRKAEVTE